jgi:hypothetical protein
VLTITPTDVQAVSNPSVPQFSIKLVGGAPYDVFSSTTTVIDQYTGKEKTIEQGGYRVDNRRIELTIPKSSFKPYTDKDGNEYNLYYNVQVKAHFGENWKNFCNDNGGTNTGYTYTVQSASGNTVIADPHTAIFYVGGSQLDFKVEAVIGAYIPWDPGRLYTTTYLSIVAQSGWSGVKTFTLPDDTSLPYPPIAETLPPLNATSNDSQSQLPNQSQPIDYTFSNPFLLLGVGIIFSGVVVAVVMIFIKKYLKTLTYTT